MRHVWGKLNKGPALLGCAGVRRVDSAPGSCGTDMGSLRRGLSGSVRIEGKCAVRNVLFTAKLRCSPQRRQTSASLGAQASLRVPSPCPDISYSVQTEGTRPWVDIKRLSLACDTLADRDISAVVG